MRKLLSCVLVIFVAASASAQNQTTPIPRADEISAAPSPQSDCSRPDVAQAVSSGDIGVSFGVCRPLPNIPHSEAAFSTASGADAVLGRARTEAKAGYPQAQDGPTSSQRPPVHRSHHLRNFVIIFTVVAVLLTVLAAAELNKS